MVTNETIWDGMEHCSGGESGIRTHGTVARTPVFETGAFVHSAISPRAGLSIQSVLVSFGMPLLHRNAGSAPLAPYPERVAEQRQGFPASPIYDRDTAPLHSQSDRRGKEATFTHNRGMDMKDGTG